MKKYSREWKIKTGQWVQRHKSERWGYVYKIHYIANDTEYSQGEYVRRIDAEEALRSENE